MNISYTPKRIAPPILAYIVAILYVVVAITFITSFVFLANKNFSMSINFLLVSVGIALVLIFLANFFSWVCLASIETVKGVLKYKTRDIISVAGHSETVYTIREVVRVKKIGKAYKLWGSFFVKEPMSKEKHREYIVLRYYNDEMISKIKEIYNDNLCSRKN